jgi:uncharacterized protein (TIGR02246 family)
MKARVQTFIGVAMTAPLNAAQTVASVVDALNRQQLDAALAFYEPQATFVVEPGQTVLGRAAIREALAHMLAARPRLVTESCRVIETDRLALYQARWAMHGMGPDGASFTVRGESADVLRLSSDGRWRIALDNPWGAAVLAAAAAPA